jgi:hypothetical protein
MPLGEHVQHALKTRWMWMMLMAQPCFDLCGNTVVVAAADVTVDSKADIVAESSVSDADGNYDGDVPESMVFVASRVAGTCADCCLFSSMKSASLTVPKRLTLGKNAFVEFEEVVMNAVDVELTEDRH